MAPFALPAGEVEHMAEKAAGGRAEHMQDAERPRAGCRGRIEKNGAGAGRRGLDVQNQRSFRTIVSPGFTG